MREALKDRVTAVLVGVLLLLVLVEATVVPHDHPEFPWHHLPGYAALIGLLACIFVVLLSKALGRHLLQRPESDEH